MLFNPTTLLIGALSVLLLTGGAYIKGRQDGAAIQRADQAEVLELARQVRDEAQRGAAAAIAQIEIKHTTIRQQLEREIHEKPVYRDCQHDAGGLQRINAALTGREPVAPGSGKLPRLDATQ
jgi:hypothetical protein